MNIESVNLMYLMLQRRISCYSQIPYTRTVDFMTAIHCQDLCMTL
jgi:hypothetical protein